MSILVPEVHRGVVPNQKISLHMRQTWNQFEYNEKQFGITSTYSEDLRQRTSWGYCDGEHSRLRRRTYTRRSWIPAKSQSRSEKMSGPQTTSGRSPRDILHRPEASLGAVCIWMCAASQDPTKSRKSYTQKT